MKLVLYDPFARTATILFRQLKTKAAAFADDLARGAAPPATQPPSTTAS